MNIKDIRQLVKLVESSEIGEIEIVEEGNKLRISKNSKYGSNGAIAVSPPPVNYAVPAPAAACVRRPGRAGLPRPAARKVAPTGAGHG